MADSVILASSSSHGGFGFTRVNRRMTQRYVCVPRSSTDVGQPRCAVPRMHVHLDVLQQRLQWREVLQCRYALVFRSFPNPCPSISERTCSGVVPCRTTSSGIHVWLSRLAIHQLFPRFNRGIPVKCLCGPPGACLHQRPSWRSFGLSILSIADLVSRLPLLYRSQ